MHTRTMCGKDEQVLSSLVLKEKLGCNAWVVICLSGKVDSTLDWCNPLWLILHGLDWPYQTFECVLSTVEVQFSMT